MALSLSQYGAGIGIPFGAGVATTAATVANVSDELGVVVGFGVAGGLVVGGRAGRFAELTAGDENWLVRLVGFTLAISLLAGASLGWLTAWSLDAPATAGLLAGGATGGLFAAMLSAALVSAARPSATATESARGT